MPKGKKKIKGWYKDMYTIIGMERKSGEYQGNAYDNTILYCTYDNAKCTGLACAQLKVKTERLNGVAIGDTVTPYYDRYGNIIELR